MRQWLRRARGAIGMGVLWAVVWAPVAVLIGTQIIDPTDAHDEMWLMVGAIPGFLSGVAFSVVLGIAARRRSLGELSIVRVGAWGALAGVLIGALPMLLGDTGGKPWIGLAATVVASITALSAVSAAGSLAVARRGERRELGVGERGTAPKLKGADLSESTNRSSLRQKSR